MSRERHDDRCRDCRPALVDIRTRTVLPDAHPDMRAINAVWEGTTLAERRAWHRVTCQNSRRADDMTLAGAVVRRMEASLAIARAVASDVAQGGR